MDINICILGSAALAIFFWIMFWVVHTHRTFELAHNALGYKTAVVYGAEKAMVYLVAALVAVAVVVVTYLAGYWFWRIVQWLSLI
jgi:hypothetical protein